MSVVSRYLYSIVETTSKLCYFPASLLLLSGGLVQVAATADTPLLRPRKTSPNDLQDERRDFNQCPITVTNCHRLNGLTDFRVVAIWSFVRVLILIVVLVLIDY